MPGRHFARGCGVAMVGRQAGSPWEQTWDQGPPEKSGRCWPLSLPGEEAALMRRRLLTIWAVRVTAPGREGIWSPKLGIIVPYRDLADHPDEFLLEAARFFCGWR